MANEHLPRAHEHERPSGELEALKHEQQERLREQRETEVKEADKSPERSAESIRHEIESIKQEKREDARAEKQQRRQEREPQLNNKKTRDASYKRIMAQTQSELPAASRAFSKVIHAPVVEKASEITANSIARPNAILSGAVFASILTLAVYLIARWYGYPLSGFETIGSFLLGWIVGNMYDFFRVMITGKKA